MPQVQSIRSALDNGFISMVITEKEYSYVFSMLTKEPDIIICDSQIIDKIIAQTPAHIPLTTFSILIAKQKGDLNELIRGVSYIKKLKSGDTIIIQEACSHHAQKDDIARVKIPTMLEKQVGGKLNFVTLAGKSFTEYQNVNNAKLIIHCGACTLTQKQMMQRIYEAKSHNLPITNFGMILSELCGSLERVLSPFKETLQCYKNYLNS